MLDVDGYEALNNFGGNWATAKILFVLLESDAVSDGRCQAWQLGANNYVIKSVKLSQLLEAIANALKLSQPV